MYNYHTYMFDESEKEAKYFIHISYIAIKIQSGSI